jgi:signal peptidase II
VALIGLSTLVVLVDQVTKFWIQSHMAYGESKPVITDIFHITYILNPGAAFGILENKTWFFVFVAVILVIGVAYIYPRLPDDRPLMRVGAGLLTGGAVGNLIDRIRIGYVVDFFDFRIWPIFNIADICIVCGVVCLAYVLLLMPEKTQTNATDAEREL